MRVRSNIGPRRLRKNIPFFWNLQKQHFLSITLGNHLCSSTFRSSLQESCEICIVVAIKN